MLFTSAVGQLFAAASRAGLGDADFSAAAQHLTEMTGVRLSETRTSGARANG
jgi:hypothetical protein